MRILQSSVALAAVLSLSGCSTLGSLLSTPFKWFNGMADAVGNAVSDAGDADARARDLSPGAVAGRGAEIAAKGPHGGADMAVSPEDPALSGAVAHR